MAEFIDRSQTSLQLPGFGKVAGNAEQYAVANAQQLSDSTLAGKRIFFLGSSITYGAGSLGESFVDFLNHEDQLSVIKDTISGTDLAGKQNKFGKSYVTRFTETTPLPVDGIVIQLSTNDGRHGIPLGKISSSTQPVSLNWHTSTGAIEYLLATAHQKWHAPVAFYTCLRNAPDYDLLVTRLKELQTKWHFAILDLRADPHISQISRQDAEMMVDDAHPTRKGYEKLWTPFFRRTLTNWLG